MEVCTLISRYKLHNPRGHFFDRDTLKWFGERESEMRVLKETTKIRDISGEEHECYILSSRQRPPFGKPIRVYHYFDNTTYEQIIT